MKGRWKRPVSGLKWYRQVQRDFAASGRHPKKGRPEGPSSRKPPVASDSHAEIDDWMRRVMPDLHPSCSGWTR